MQQQKIMFILFVFFILIERLRLAMVERKTFINELSRTQLKRNARQHQNK